MRIEQRVKKLEKKARIPEVPKYHLVIVEPGASEDEVIKKYKIENEIGINDKIYVIRFVSPKGEKNDSK